VSGFTWRRFWNAVFCFEYLWQGKNVTVDCNTVIKKKTKNLKLLWKKCYALIRFIQLKSTLVNRELRTVSQDFYYSGTGCGRKNSPIWKANKFKTKEDTANVFYFWKAHRMPFYINVFWTKHHSSGGLEYWYTCVASLGSCPWPWESFQV